MQHGHVRNGRIERRSPVMHANARLSVLFQFFCCGVDVALMWNALMQTPPRRAARKQLIILRDFGCGGRI